MNKLARIEALKIQEKAYTDQLKFLKEERQALEAGLPLGLVTEGDLIAEVKETVRFDAATAKKNLSPEQYESILVLKPDTAAARNVLTGAEYSTCQKVVGRSVTFKKD